MASQILPSSDDFDRFIRWVQWLRIEAARREIQAGDSLFGTLPPHKDTSSSPWPAMTEVEALAIGQAAGSFVLTGAPDPATFDLARIEAALPVLHSLAYDRYEGTRQASALRTVFVALAGVQRGLKFGRKIRRAAGPQKASLRAALDTLPALIADLEGDGGDYWRSFCREALAEVRELWEGGAPG